MKNKIDLAAVAVAAAGFSHFWDDERDGKNLWLARIFYPDPIVIDSKQLWDIAAAVAIMFVEEYRKRDNELLYGYCECIEYVAKKIAEKEAIWDEDDDLDIVPNERVRKIINEALDAHGDFGKDD